MFFRNVIFGKKSPHSNHLFPDTKIKNVLKDVLYIIGKFQKILLPLIIFLIPSQLSYHFWPEWSYVFGLRVDYLSVSIYLTEVLVFLLLFLWFLETLLRKIGGDGKKHFIFNKKEKVLFLFLFTFSLINVFNSINIYISIISWIKFYLLFFFTLYLAKLKNFNLRKWFIDPLSYSLIFFAALGIAQFIKGSSLGGIFYFLGERSFSTNTPSIALSSFFGRELLRPYSTFPHPNAFSGFYLISILFLTAVSGNKRDRLRNFFVYVFSFFVFVFTFSKSVFLSVMEILFFGIYFKIIGVYLKKIKKNFLSLKLLNYVVVFFFLVSLAFLFFSGSIEEINSDVFNTKPFLSGFLNRRSFIERVDLLKMAGNILKDNYLFGVGKNTFIKETPPAYYGNSVSWILQPVHNVFLLSFAELGIFGFLTLFIFLEVLAKKVYKTGNIILFFLVVAFLTTLFLDHYWYTLEQNQLLLAVIFGILFNKKYLLEFKKS